LEERVGDEGPILVTDENSQQINEEHYFEFMDRVSVAGDYIYQFIGSHPLMKRESRFQKIYERAEQALTELYQEAATLDYEKTNKSN
jgi:5-formaminoimidazole-4-carboxamide-1-beta-D-ribofuranosyl 5'-monophosphate synthetase